MINIQDPEFNIYEVSKKLKNAANDINLVTDFWQPLTSPYVELFNYGMFALSRNRLLTLLHNCKSLDQESYVDIHKGNPFYFIGIASFLINDFETAVYFMDAAVTEDLNIGAHPTSNPRASTRFLTLEGEKNDQFAKGLTKIAEIKVQRAINFYNSLD